MLIRLSRMMAAAVLSITLITPASAAVANQDFDECLGYCQEVSDSQTDWCEKSKDNMFFQLTYEYCMYDAADEYQNCATQCYESFGQTAFWKDDGILGKQPTIKLG